MFLKHYCRKITSSLCACACLWKTPVSRDTLYESAAKPSRSQETWEVYLLSVSPLNKANIWMNRIAVFKKKGFYSFQSISGTSNTGSKQKVSFHFSIGKKLCSRGVFTRKLFQTFIFVWKGSPYPNASQAVVPRNHICYTLSYSRHFT